MKVAPPTTKSLQCPATLNSSGRDRRRRAVDSLASSLTALAAHASVVGTGLETGAIRAIGVETARTDYRAVPPWRARGGWKTSRSSTGWSCWIRAFGDGVIEAWISGDAKRHGQRHGARLRGRGLSSARRGQAGGCLSAADQRPGRRTKLRRNMPSSNISHPDHPWDAGRAEAPAPSTRPMLDLDLVG